MQCTWEDVQYVWVVLVLRAGHRARAWVEHVDAVREVIESEAQHSG